MLLVLYAYLGHPGPMKGTSFYKPYEGAITAEKVQAAQEQLQNKGYSDEANQNRYGVIL